MIKIRFEGVFGSLFKNWITSTIKLKVIVNIINGNILILILMRAKLEKTLTAKLINEWKPMGKWENLTVF